MLHKLEKLPRSRIRLIVTVDSQTIQKFYDLAATKVGQHIEIPGFRKGHTPQALVIDRVGNRTVLAEMIDILVPESYYKVIKALKDYYPVEQPKIEVKELKGLTETIGLPNQLTYIAEVDVMPEVQVGDYKKIRITPKKTVAKIDDQEIEATLAELKKTYGDDYLKIGNFKNEAAWRQAIVDRLKQQKVVEAESQTLDMLIEAILKQAKVEVPEAFIHNEIHRLERQLEMQAKARGLSFDDWLKQEGKTHEDIHRAWRPQAEKAAKVGLVLGKIAETEGIDPNNNNASRLVLNKLRDYAVQ